MVAYRTLISNFLDRGYQPYYFSQSPPEKGALILRHDIDFDIGYAHQLSLIEDELGVRSTYFFLLHSKSYNLLEDTHLKMIESIKSRGNHISIHFDPTLYEDIETGLQREKELFERLFDTKIECVSIHRPSDFFLNRHNAIAGVNHTYQPIYFQKIKYFADSQGEFRYGHPENSEEFRNLETIQLLIHPIWWVTASTDPVSKLKEFLGYRINQFRQHMASNCKPYKKYLETQ